MNSFPDNFLFTTIYKPGSERLNYRGFSISREVKRRAIAIVDAKVFYSISTAVDNLIADVNDTDLMNDAVCFLARPERFYRCRLIETCSARPFVK